MKLDQTTHVETGMLIRRPVSEVFEAFVYPSVTTKFWFTDSTGRLEKGKTVEWSWKMYGVSAVVSVEDLIPDRAISIEWGPKDSNLRSHARWTFEATDEGNTFVRIAVDGFPGDDEAVFHSLTDSVSGFGWVLAGLKAWLEHRIRLNLVPDRYPKGK